MILELETCGGGTYQLPTLLSWELDLTSSVPCDSMTAVCPYDPAMADVLPKAVRFTARQDGGIMLRGVVDAYEISLSHQGLLMSLEGRGMAALLLDNESEALTYARALLPEILENHVTPYGIRVEKAREVSGGSYAVTSGASQWKAVQGFTRRFGGFDPYFTREGTLVAAPLWGSGRTLELGNTAPLPHKPVFIEFRDKTLILQRQFRVRALFLHHIGDQPVGQFIQIALQFAALNRPVYIHDKLPVLRHYLEDLQHSFLPGVIGFLPLQRLPAVLDAAPLHQIVDILEMIVEGHPADTTVRRQILDRDLVQLFVLQQFLEGRFQCVLGTIRHDSIPINLFKSIRSSSILTGLAVCAFIPDSRQCCMSSEKASAVMAMIGIVRASSLSSALMLSVAS